MSNYLYRNTGFSNPCSYRIAYIPMEDIGNAYSNRMREILSTFGKIEPYKGTKSSILGFLKGQKTYELIVVNWTDNEVSSKKFSNRISVSGTFKIFLKLFAMRMASHRTIFIRHNNYPHTLSGISAVMAKWLIDQYERFFDAVITHSGAHTDKHRIYCPHPLYKKDILVPNIYSSAPIPPVKYFVSFGRIMPYKNLIELVINFPEEKILFIIGSVGDNEYVKQLRKIKRNNVIFSPGKLSEIDAQSIVMQSEGVVISHADGDVVVSGTFFYAISLHRRVFAVSTPFLTWMKPRLENKIISLSPNVIDLCNLIATSDNFDEKDVDWKGVDIDLNDDSVRAHLVVALGALEPIHG